MDWFIARLSKYGDSIAFRDDEITSYTQLVNQIGEVEQLCEQAGIQSGDIVVVHGHSNADMFATIVTLMKKKAIAVPLTHQSPLSIDDAIRISHARFIFTIESKEIKKINLSYPKEYPLLEDLKNDNLGGLILFTSGSTGKPKAILYDSNTLLDKFKVQRNPIKALQFLMMDHFGGLNTVLSILCSGGEAICLRDRSVETVCRAVEAHKIKVLPVTPSFIRLLLLSGAFERFDLSSLQKITFGTEPMTQATLNILKDRFPRVELQQTYGLSEVGVLRSKSKPDGTLWMKIGGEGFEWKVIDGILWIRSQFQMRGYLNADADVDEEGFFNTQDQVVVDGDYVQILGRVSEIINVGGEKVYPTEIENFLEDLVNISDAIVYKEENALLGQVIAVDVVLDVPEDMVQLRKRIRDACREKLGRNKVPSKIRIIEEVQVSSRQKKIRSR